MALSRSLILLAVTICLTQVWAQYQPKCGSTVMYIINADNQFTNYGYDLLSRMAGTPSFSFFDVAALPSGPFSAPSEHGVAVTSVSVENFNAVATDIKYRNFASTTRITLLISARITSGHLTSVDDAAAVVAAANRLKSVSNVEIFIIDYPEDRSNLDDFQYKLAQDVASNTVESHLFFSNDIYAQILAPAFAGVSSATFATLGDPYISTLDGNVYNFQGLGEFTLYRGEDYIMQVRMAPCDNSNPSSRTCNRAIAFKSANSEDTFELHYDPVAQHLTTYGGGIIQDTLEGYYYAGQEWGYNDWYYYIEKYDTPIDTDTIFLATIYTYWTNSQFQVAFGNKVGLAVSGSLDPMNFGRVQGLVGTWDGCADNDYYSHNQTYTSPSAASRDIYFNFADTWRVSEAESLFTHGVNAQYYMPYYDELSPSWNPAFSAVDPSANAASDCSFFKSVSPVLYFACMDDVSKGNGDIRPIGYMLTSIACSDYCYNRGFANMGYVSKSYCASTCAKPNALDFHYNYNETNSDLYTLTTTAVGATFSATLGGTYTYSLTSDFCPDASVTGTVQITCDQPPVVSAGDDRVIQKHPVWQWPIAVLMGSASDVNNAQLQYHWTFLSVPGDYNYTAGEFPPSTSGGSTPYLFGESTLTPYFYIEYPGDYVLELSVYDGCFFSKDTVTVHAVCGGCKLYVESAEIQDQTYESNGINSNTWQGVSFKSSAYNFDYEYFYSYDYHWFIDSNSRGYNFSYPPQASTDVYTFTVTPAEQFEYRNISTVVTSSFTPVATTGSINTATILRYEGLGHFETDTSVVRTTTTTLEHFSSVPLPITMCKITIANADSSTPTFTVTYDRDANISHPFTQTPSCVGDYTVRVAARDECNTAHDLANFHLGCSEQPQAHLVSCQKTVKFNYAPNAAGSFPTVQLNGKDTFDPDTPLGNLLYQWEILNPNGVTTYYDCGTEEGSTNAYVNCPIANIIPAAGPGVYNIRMWVSDACTYDFESTTITGQCETLSVSASGVNVNQDTDSPAFGTFNFTADYVAATAEQDAAVVDSWELVSFPVGYDIVPSRAPLTMGATNATASAYIGGSYTYMYTAYDGCRVSSQNVTVTYTCSSPMSFGLTPVPQSQVFAVGLGAYEAVTVTVTMNETVNTNAGRAKYQASLVSRPLGSSASIANNGIWTAFNGGANPTILITPDIPGSYIIQVYVWDSCNLQVKNVTIDASCTAPQVPIINNAQSSYVLPSRGSVVVDNLYIDDSFSNYTITWTLTNVATNVTSTLLTGFGKTNVTFSLSASGDYVVNVRAATPLAACFADAAAPVTITATCNYTLSIDAPATYTSNMVRGKFERVTVKPGFSGVDPKFDPMSSTLTTYQWRFLSAPEGSVFAPTYDNTTIVTVNTTNVGNYVYDGYNWTRTTTSILEFKTVVHTKYVTLVYDDSFDSYDGCFAPDVYGTYVLQFTIVDYCGKTLTQTYTVTTNCNAAPTANAGSAATYTFEGTGFSFGTYKYTAIPLNGTASDSDNDFLDLQWSVISQPNNATGPITINNPQSRLASFVPNQVGTYVLQLQATDGCSTVNSTVAITVVCPATFQVNAPISFTFDGYTPVALQEFSLLANPQCTRALYWTITSYSPATAIPPPSATTTESPKSGASQIAIPAFLIAFLALFVKMF